MSSEMFAQLMARMEARDNARDAEMKKFREETEAREKAREEKHQEELRKIREEREADASTDTGNLKSMFRRWEGYVQTLNHHGYDFDERDIASLSVEYRERKNLMPRFCDGNEITRISNSHLISMVNTLKEKGCSDDLIKTAVVMYVNRNYALTKSFTKGGYYYKGTSRATNKEDRDAGVKVVRYVPKVKSSVDDLLSFNIFIGGKAVKASTIFHGSPYKLSYETIGMNCGDPIPDMLNLFTPHPFFLELKKASRQQLKDMAREAKAWERLLMDQAGSKQAYDYIYNWLAHLVQFPGVKMGVALGMYGPKGTGKNTLLRPFQKLFGRHYLETSNGDHVFGKFTELLDDKLIVNLNEAFFGGKKETMGAIKHITTEDTIVIDTKGVSKYIQENVLNLIIMSNNDRIVPAEEDERRYAIFELKGRYSGAATSESKEYFDRVRAIPTKAVLAALLLRDISNWNPREIPQTDALRHQQSQGLNTCYAFWHEAMKNDGEIFGKAYLTDEELLKYHLAHRKPKSAMGFGDDNLAYELVPGMKPGLRSPKSVEEKGIPRVELRTGGKTNEVTIYWTYEEDELMRCAMRKELVFKIFDQWQYRNRPKHQITSDKFWTLTPRVIKLVTYKPRDKGESKRPEEIILPTQQEARDYFAKAFMRDECYFHTYEYELQMSQLEEEYESQAETLTGDDRKELDEWYESTLANLKEKYGRLDTEQELPWEEELENLEVKRQPPPLPSRPPPPLPNTAPPALPSRPPPPLPSIAMRMNEPDPWGEYEGDMDMFD